VLLGRVAAGAAGKGSREIGEERREV